MTHPTTADLIALLRRAEARERETVKDAGAATLGDLFAADEARRMTAAFGGGDSEAERDRLRSEADARRANDLELKRALGTITDEEEAERADLAARRERDGYYRPTGEAGQ